MLFTETRDGVLFHNTQGGFHLASKSAYRFAALIVPYLDGTTRVSDLCEGLPDAQRVMVADLVKALLERGFARDVQQLQEPEALLPTEVRERFAPQISYVQHHEDRAEERFRRFRDARVAILGDDQVARWCALSILRNGGAAVAVLPSLDVPQNAFGEILAEAEALRAEGIAAEVTVLPSKAGLFGWDDLAAFDMVVCAGTDASRQVFRLLETGVPRSRRLLSVTSFGSRAVVGPLMTDESPSCWACAVLRLGANDAAGHAAEVWSGICLPGAGLPAAAPGRHLSAMLGNLLGYEVFREFTGVLPVDTAGRVVVQDFASLDLTAQQILPHPACPFCRTKEAARDAAEADAADLQGVVLTAPTVSSVVTADAADTLVNELNERSTLVGATGGVFIRFDDDAPTQLPLKVTRVELGVGGGERRSVAAFDVHHVAGARIRGLQAAAAVYVEHVAPLTRVLSGDSLAEADAALRSVAPRELGTFSGLGGDQDAVGDWVVATSLLTGDRVLVPAAAVRPFGQYNGERMFEPTSAGTGVGDTVGEAAYQGLFSALCHQAMRQAIVGARKALRVTPASLDADAELAFLAASAANLGLEADLLDLSDAERGSARILLAHAVDPKTGEARWAAAADAGFKRAATAALRDLVGQFQLAAEVPEGEQVDLGDRLFDSFDARALAVAGEAVADLGAAGTVEEVLDGLRAAGRDVLAVPNTSGDLRSNRTVALRVLLAGEPS
ncbi:TOMM precursor leader peptide-binding protein [Streptomyces mirabilis]|uniref:TOMM precursor leader peptide-binding protein n=1 Tax=Streptomyces mirabilis TaxID=68239 RepID=UPI00371E4531